MQAIEHLQDNKWEYPGDYGGFSPAGDFVIYSRSRDSEIIGNVNYERILEDLNKLSSQFEAPVNPDIESGDMPYVYDFRAGHWACGWVEYILIRQDAPDKIKQLAGEIICALAEYPIYDESAYSDAQYEAICDYWSDMSIGERVETCAESGDSIYSARRDHMPDNVYSTLSDSIY